MFIPYPLWLHSCAHSSLAGRPPFAVVGGRGHTGGATGEKETEWQGSFRTERKANRFRINWQGQHFPFTGADSQYIYIYIYVYIYTCIHILCVYKFNDMYISAHDLVDWSYCLPGFFSKSQIASFIQLLRRNAQCQQHQTPSDHWNNGQICDWCRGSEKRFSNKSGWSWAETCSHVSPKRFIMVLARCVSYCHTLSDSSLGCRGLGRQFKELPLLFALFKAFQAFRLEGPSILLASLLLFQHMGVSWNRGTPKSSMLVGFSLTNHPFWGTSIYGKPHIPNIE